MCHKSYEGPEGRHGVSPYFATGSIFSTGLCSTFLLLLWPPFLRIGGYGFTDHAHSPFVRRGLNEVITYKSEAAKPCTPTVLSVCVHSMGMASRHREGFAQSLQRTVVCRLWMSSDLCFGGARKVSAVRPCSVFHGSLHTILSSYQIFHNTSVREMFSIAALSKRQVSFEDRLAAFHCLGAQPSTWQHRSKLRGVSICIGMANDHMYMRAPPRRRGRRLRR